jgi:hypothetical protein
MPVPFPGIGKLAISSHSLFLHPTHFTPSPYNSSSSFSYLNGSCVKKGAHACKFRLLEVDGAFPFRSHAFHTDIDSFVWYFVMAIVSLELAQESIKYKTKTRS